MAVADSPCNGVCTIDPRSKFCMGCWRTISEIGSWSRMSYTQRQVLRAALAKRAKAARSG